MMARLLGESSHCLRDRGICHVWVSKRRVHSCCHCDRHFEHAKQLHFTGTLFDLSNWMTSAYSRGRAGLEALVYQS